VRTAVVRPFNEPLCIEDRPMPEPGHGEVVVEVEVQACATPTFMRHTVTGR
jgi:D-arabinose 1-dehydrogenase-like Zn-dependent alcohol dehydrogenase